MKKEIDWTFDDEEVAPRWMPTKYGCYLDLNPYCNTLKIERFNESKKHDYFNYFTDIYNASDDQLKTTGWRKYTYYKSKIESRKNRLLRSKAKIKNRLLFLILKKKMVKENICL